MNTEDDPRHLRMFVDDVSGVALWTDWGAPEDSLLETQLPIPQDLRDRIKAWVDDYTRNIREDHGWSPADFCEHDRKGYHLSLELQAELGSDYTVEYSFHTALCSEVTSADLHDPQRPCG